MSENNKSKEDLPNISIVTILHDWEKFFPLFKYNWNNFDYPKEKLEWIFIDDSKNDYSDIIYDIDNNNENILYLKVDSDEYLEKINFPNDENKLIWNVFKKTKTLPIGFKRDYATGMCSSEYIFHLDFDCIYKSNVLKRKLKFLRNNRLGCVYCKEMLCYDLYGKKFYKTENKFGYESTLFHTKEFWSKSGFKWEDMRMEAINFYYNKGSERKMDNYYDTIKLLSVHNINLYQPKEISIENLNLKVPDMVNELSIDNHPIQVFLNDIFYQKNINVVGINSEILEHIKTDNWIIENILINKKMKEKNIIKEIKNLNKDFDFCIINTRFPIWKFFDSFKFDVILLESDKNHEQMDSILKSKNYFNFDGIYFNQDYLIN